MQLLLLLNTAKNSDLISYTGKFYCSATADEFSGSKFYTLDDMALCRKNNKVVHNCGTPTRHSNGKINRQTQNTRSLPVKCALEQLVLSSLLMFTSD